MTWKARAAQESEAGRREVRERKSGRKMEPVSIDRDKIRGRNGVCLGCRGQ